MKRILRSFLTLLMLVVWASGFAQSTVTFDAKTDKSTTKSLTKDGVTIEIGNGTLNNGTDYRCYNNNPKTFKVTSTTGNITKIELTCTASNTGKGGPGCFARADVGKYTYSDKIGTWNGDAKSVTLTHNNQVRIAKVVVTLAATKTLKSLAISGAATKKAYNDGDAFDPAGLVVTGTYDDNTTATITNGITWTTTPAKLTAGTTSCSVTATVNGVTSPAYEVTGLTVAKNLTLSIDPTTSEVVKAPVTVTLTANAGATIYYTLNGDAPSTNSTKYDASFEVTKSGITVKAIAVADGAENATAEATYTIKPEQPVFSELSKTFKDAFNVTLSLPESTDQTSKIYYAIGKTATAESSLYEGPINISAENDGDKVILHAVVVDQYGNVGKEKFCTYTKTTAIVFDFTGDWEGITPLEINNDETAANVVAGKELKVNGIVMTATNGSSNKTCLYGSKDSHNLRVYSDGSITFTAPEGYNISVVTFDNKSVAFNTTVGTYKTGTWTGNEHAVTFTATKSVKLNNATIKLVAVANTPLPLDENAENTGDVLLGTESGKVYDVTLARTLTANVWNTICLPFDVTAEQIADVLKSAGNVKEYDREDATKQTIYFKDATTMVAGKPYLIKPTESAKELVFKGVKITEYEPNKKVGGDNYAVYGTFGKYTMKTDGTELFLKTDGKFYIPAAGTATMKGFRAYFFNINGSTAGAALNLSFGDATGINGVAADAEKNVKVYNVNGQYVGTSLEALPKGLYIVGGKKVLK